ncbi:archaellum component FlaF (FlaF/FlaG flagellin family) [Paenibacillus sp. V4I9]|uniref:copper amine oxidase N-terminal domain-containing protein n=1 Tax=Paenibacillus sp. V4I9 TaxID=3042308 RepID=UPI00278346B0|nr:copper amine oxidase N-terminal domain-containing protein [Paenibacillus sp. V4I9]MDQ0885088.1 archaellum component FlaF (FlaF/FlaG flagellin family) [Paenibacillus sp. V4I9]
MTNKTIATLTIAATIFASALVPTAAFGSQSSDLRMIPVIVNGQKVKFPDTEPYIDGNGRTMVPVRFVSEKLGATVVWNNADNAVTIKYGTKEINLPLNSNTVTVNGTTVTLDTSAVLTDGRTMVPLRFVSEALSSEVVWDEGAHSVKVTDSSYKTKVTNGTVSLDAWGRELSKTYSTDWNKLTDLPEKFYNLPYFKGLTTDSFNRDWMLRLVNFDLKTYVDKWANKVKEYYEVQLNVDYRTIDEDTFTNTLLSNMQFPSTAHKEATGRSIRKYVQWVKDNHVIAKGYADPESSQTRAMNGMPTMRTHFKFMIISADDTTQTFMDNYDPSAYSESPALNTGVWYDGYADVALFTNIVTTYEKYLAVRSNENMFRKGQYSYEQNKDE